MNIREQKIRRRAAEKRKEAGKNIFRVLAAVIIVAAVCIGIWNIKIKNVEVINNERYTPQQIVDMLFATENEKRSLLTFLKELVHTPHKELPMIQSYSIEFTGIDSVSVIVYENKLVGCIYYMGSYMYFDRDGLIVESRTEPYEGIPVIDGIQFDQIVLYQKLSVTKEGIFDAVMNLTQLLSVHEIQADKITYDEYDMVTVTIGDVKVSLGDSSNMEGKISELAAMQSKFGDLKGTLHLETYDESRQDAEYYFDIETD